MGDAVLALQMAGGASFVVLGLLNLRARARQQERRYGYLGLALGLLGLITLVDRSAAAFHVTSRALIDLEVVFLLASGYSFLLFRASFVPLPTRSKRLVALGLAAAAIFAIAARVPGGPAPRYTPLNGVAVAVLLLTWCGCTIEPIVRFWSAARSRPPIQQARLRMLSAAYAEVMVLVFVLSGLAAIPAQRTSIFTAIGYGLGLLAAPVLALSFAPPAWLRRLWQARDQLDWNRATEDLLKFSSETEDIAARGVAWAVRALGGEAGFIADVDGSVLSSVGIPAGESRQMLEHLVGSPLPRIVGLPGDRGDHIVAVPVDSRLGVGTLAVVSGPFTPVFGTHEVASLEQYARPVSLALDRVRLVQALEQQTVRYESLLKAASDLGEGVLLTDAGRLLFANQAYVDLTGYTFEELASMPSLLELAVPEEREAIAGYLRSRLDGRIAPDRYESAFVHKDGHRVDVEVSVKLLPGKGQRQIVSLVRDITDRKRAEATLRDAYERQRQAVEELRRADEMKNAFLSAVSHELRTPLTSVLGYALTLEHQYDGLQPRERLDFLSRLAHNARKLDRLLADLLDLGRLTRGVLLLDRHRVDVGALVRRVLREADTGGHPLSAQIEAAEAEVDPPKVERIVENLVANAAKHTPAGTGIVVRVKGEGSNVLVTVEDEGPGIPPELRASIFEPFERGPGAPAHAPGTGIGLTLVARFAELHGGRTWVSDRVGGGASFKVLLPRYQGRPADGDDRSDPDAGSPERTDQSEERQPAGSGGPVGAGAG